MFSSSWYYNIKINYSLSLKNFKPHVILDSEKNDIMYLCYILTTAGSVLGFSGKCISFKDNKLIILYFLKNTILPF